jgi:hypothetical protein
VSLGWCVRVWVWVRVWVLGRGLRNALEGCGADGRDTWTSIHWSYLPESSNLGNPEGRRKGLRTYPFGPQSLAGSISHRTKI